MDGFQGWDIDLDSRAARWSRFGGRGLHDLIIQRPLNWTEDDVGWQNRLWFLLGFCCGN